MRLGRRLPRSTRRAPLTAEAFDLGLGNDIEAPNLLGGNMACLDVAPQHGARDAQFTGSLGECHVTLHSAQSSEWTLLVTGYHGSQIPADALYCIPIPVYQI